MDKIDNRKSETVIFNRIYNNRAKNKISFESRINLLLSGKLDFLF